MVDFCYQISEHFPHRHTHLEVIHTVRGRAQGNKMSDIQLYLFEIDKDKQEASRLAAQTVTKLQTKQLKLVELIESLGEYLNNEDASIRSKSNSASYEKRSMY